MERFLSKVRPADNGCIEWTAAKNPAGYGVFNCDGKRTMLAHRFAYQTHHGVTLGRDDVVMHTCDNPSCVNLAHLALGTHADNHDDKKRKGRSNVGTRHGHHKLTEAEAREIRSLSMRQKDIAAKYGISQSVVSEIRAGKAWRHI